MILLRLTGTIGEQVPYQTLNGFHIFLLILPQQSLNAEFNDDFISGKKNHPES